jgi:putative Mg2+ transporter-C (MgtC) family protein
VDTQWVELVEHPVVKITLAILLSGVIGYERELSNKPAGLRTNILIGLSSTLMMMISIHVADRFGAGTTDPSRIAAQVLTGIGFLGAGTIMQARGSVVGLTTAATIWAVAGVGLAVGSGLYALAIMVTGAILLVLWVLGRLEKRKLGKRATECLLLRISNPAPLMRILQQIYSDTRARVEEWEVQEAAGAYTVRFTFQGSDRERQYIHALLRGAPGVERVEPVSFRIPE